MIGPNLLAVLWCILIASQWVEIILTWKRHKRYMKIMDLNADRQDSLAMYQVSTHKVLCKVHGKDFWEGELKAAGYEFVREFHNKLYQQEVADAEA